MDKAYRAILFSGIAALMLFSPLARGAVKVWSMTPVLLTLYAIIFIWLLKRANTQWGQSRFKERGSRGTVPILLPITLFAILAIVSCVFSIYKHDSLYALLRLFAYIGLYYIVANELDHTTRKRILWLAVVMGGALSLYGLLQYFGICGHGWWMPERFLAATYRNHNHFAGYLELVIPVALVMITTGMARASVASRSMLLAALVLMFAALLLTQSRGAWVSLGCALLAMLYMTVSRDMSRARVMVAIVLVAVSAVSAAYFAGDLLSSRIATVTAADEGDDVSGGRFKIWQGATGMIRERPLTGVGIGDFDKGFYRYRPLGFNARAVYAHNEYLHMAAEMGLFAPLLMLWIFIAIMREGLGKRERSPYAFGCAIGVLSLSLHGLVDFNFHIPANMILFTVWLGIASGE